LRAVRKSRSEERRPGTSRKKERIVSDEKKYKVYGYPAKTDPDWNRKGRFIGSVDEIGDAHKLRDNAISVGWSTVLILDGDTIVE
jgi:hypothetical protein